jgi:integrase
VCPSGFKVQKRPGGPLFDLGVEMGRASLVRLIPPVETITARQCAELLGPIRSATPSQYRKLVGLLNQIFTQAVGLEWREDSPMLLAQKLLANTGKIRPVDHHPVITDWTELRELVKSIRNATGEPSVRNALYLQCLTAQRTGECLGARFEEFHDLDGETPRWVIPRSRMKITDQRRGDHVLHLSRQCAEWLRSLPQPKTKAGFLFPGRSGNDTIASEAMSKHMRNTLGMRDRMVPHSWRAALRTLAVREPSIKSEFVESILDHLSNDQVENAYQRGAHHVEAGRVLQWWADQLLA